jgi:hypothetical protein
MKTAPVDSTDLATFALTSAPATVVPYEKRLAADISYVLDEGGRLFMGESEVNRSLQRITKRLNELGIPYAVAGGMALIAHGFRRFTEDIDIIVTQEGLDRIHEHLDGRGWVRPFSTSKNLRDADNGVRIEFLVSGGYPGDGKPKPISFPVPDAVAEDHQGIKFINLPTFVEMKLASGMTNAQRGKDLIDVENLIRELPLDRDFTDKLHPYVRPKFIELWQGQQISGDRLLLAWDVPQLTTVPQSMAEILAVDDAVELRHMANDGVDVAPDLSRVGQAILFTHDRSIAAKYGMVSLFEADLKKLRELPANRPQP